jgi:hypothetical protein
MKLPRIEQQINKKGNRVKSIVAFLGLGSGAMAAAHGLPGLAGLGVIIPMAFDAYTMHKLLNGKRGFKTRLALYEPIFKTSMKKWIKKYVNEPEDIIEKKYRVIFLNAWLNSKFLKLDDVSAIYSEPFKELSNELKKRGLTKYHLDMLFNPYTESKSKDMFGEAVNFNLFINEDKNNLDKVSIAKKVYEEYSEIGLAAKQFLNNKSCDGLLMLQDYKFTSMDYSLIKTYINEPKQESYNPFSYIMIGEVIETVLPKIVEAENDVEKLKILGNYCHKVLTTEEIIDDSTLKSMQTVIKSKISYIELSSEINAQEILPGIQPKKEKRMKV